MIYVIVEELINFAPAGGEGGFFHKTNDDVFVYVDSNQSVYEQETTIVHEILEYKLGIKIPHKDIDPLARDILDGLEQLKRIIQQH